MNAARFLSAAILLTASALHAADWPNYRGPDHNGISQEKGWNASLGATPKILWKAGVGIGFSSFSVADGRVYTTGNSENTDTVYCLDAKSGKVVWKHSYPSDLGDKYFEGGTSATPTVDGERVYQLSRWGDVFCLNAASGKVIWTKNVQKETGANIPDWGFGGSPLVHGKLLVLNVGAGGVALDKMSGAIIWKSDTDSAGYNTAVPSSQGKGTELILASAKAFYGVDAQTGSKLWEFPWTTRYGVNAADAIPLGSKVFISSGYNKGCALLQTGSGTTPQEVWKNKELKNQLASSVLISGNLYGFDGDNTASRSPFKCVDFASGTVRWDEKSIGPGALVAAGSRLIILTGKGELIIANASAEKFDVISRAPVLTGKCWTAPVLANGHIYCRNSAGDAVCIDVSGN